MPAAPLHPNEAARLDALQRLQVLDTPPQAEFDDLTRLAATICGTPIALVSLIDAHRQWFKSRYGLAATETPRDVAFCAHAILQSDLFEVSDAAADERFAANPLVTADPHIRSYAGVPLVTPDGHPVGTLCAIDRVPRTLTTEQRDALRVLGRQVVAQLQLRTQVHQQAKEAREYETFRVLFEQSSDAHLIFDERDGIIDCNNATVAMLRLKSKDEVLALHPAVLSPEFQPCGRRSMDKCIEMDATARRDGHHRFDWTHRRADGEDFPCEVTLTPVHLHGRNVLLVVWHDLTERMRADETLRYQAALRGSLTESGPDGILVVDPDARILSLNQRFLDIWGIPPEAAAHGDDTLVLAAAVSRTADPKGFRTRVEEIYAHPDLVTAEEVALADGRVLERHTGPVRGADGRHYGRVWYFRDVTDRKRMEDALRASEEHLRRMVEDSPIGIYRTTPDGRILLANPVAVRLAGAKSFEELSRHNLEQDGPHSRNPRATFRQQLERDGEVRGLESEWVGEDGRPVFVRENARLVRNPDGSVYYEGTLEDVSEKRRAEEALRASAERRRQQQIALLELIHEDARDAGEAATRRVLGVVAGILQVERVSVWHLTPERDRLVCGLMYEWGADRYSSGLALPAADYPGYFAALASDEVIAASDAVTDPRTLEFRDGYLVPLGIGAMLDIPLRLNGRVGGVLCAEHVGGRREWAADEQVFALAVAGVLAVAAEQAERRRAEEALRAGEERFRGAFDHAPIGMALVGLDGRWLRVNRAICDMLGYTPDELLATDFQTLTHPDDLGADLDLVRQTLVGKIASYQMEKRYFHKSKVVVHALLAVSLMRDANGRPLYFIAHVKDVTARKRAEEAVRAGEERFRGAFDYAPIGMALVGLDGRWLRVNRAVCDILGYTSVELLATDFQTLTHPDDLKADLHLVRQVLAGEIPSYQMEKRYFRKGGAVVHAVLSVSLARDTKGRPLYYISHIKDVTARKQAEAERRESEERFRAAMEGSLDAMFFLVAERDAAGTVTDFRFTDLNTHGARLISRQREDVIGQRMCELLPVNRTDGFFDKYVRVVQTGETLEEEFPIAVEGVNAAWLHHQVVKVGDGVAITSQDVTARKRAELELRASENQLRTLGDNLPDGVVFQYVVGTDGRHRFPYMSRGIDRLAGLTAEAVMADADTLFCQTHPEDVSTLTAATRRSMEELSEFDLEIRRVNPDGVVHWFHVRSAPRRLSDGGTAWDGVMFDVTERKRTENELRASEEKFRTTLDRLAEGVFVVDVDTDRIVDVNAATLDMLGYTRDEFLALAQFDLMSGETQGSFERSAEQVRQRLTADGRCDIGRRAFKRKDGTPVPVDMKVTVVPNGRAGLRAVIVRDVTEQVEYEEQLLAYQEELVRANARLQALATTDGLTGLKNRAAFDEKLADEFERAVRHDRLLSVVMLDVDHFKSFNDTFGHPAGDVVLQQVARNLTDGVRVTDVVARYGGEEFVVLLPDTDYAGALVLAERLRRGVAGGAWEQRAITISVGVSTLTASTSDAAALVQEADQALYRSKQTGRNRVSGSNAIPQIATTRPLVG